MLPAVSISKHSSSLVQAESAMVRGWERGAGAGMVSLATALWWIR
jgi:hypothetical protein